jgi:hypothetical protein
MGRKSRAAHEGRIRRKGHFSQSLDSVDMEDDFSGTGAGPCFLDSLADFFSILHSAGFVVDSHYGDQSGMGTERFSYFSGDTRPSGPGLTTVSLTPSFSNNVAWANTAGCSMAETTM